MNPDFLNHRGHGEGTENTEKKEELRMPKYHCLLNEVKNLFNREVIVVTGLPHEIKKDISLG